MTALAMALFAAAVAVTLVVLGRDDPVAAPPPTAAATSTSAPHDSLPTESSSATTSTATRTLPRPGEQVMDVNPEADARYLGTLSDAGLITPGTDEQAVIEVGRLVCAYISTGQGDLADAGVMVLQSGEATATQAGTIVGAAVAAYCPQYGEGI
ncbi:DUF732 domain-containing protein [Geodermatophilus amargosae]|uniref:DUF732 domain-containing protein n=1 Tax=Geodermatophilus amargosae TaxID=1296565 RepID=UPI00158780A2|nr:DUF732 domain-containing protein [Geodermatophilus amargosae]